MKDSVVAFVYRLALGIALMALALGIDARLDALEEADTHFLVVRERPADGNIDCTEDWPC